MSPAENVIDRLDATRQRWWLLTFLTTTVIGVCLSFGLFLGLMVWDAVVRFGQAGLGVLFVCWLTLTAVMATVVFRRLLLNQRSLEATARRVESEFPELGSNLINLVQLAEDHDNHNRAFCLAAANQAAVNVEGVRFGQAARHRSRWARFLHRMQTSRDLAEWLVVFALLVVLTMICAERFPNLGSSAMRLLTPWRFTPSVGAVEIVEITPGDADVLIGGNLPIAARIKNTDGTPYKAFLYVARDGEPEAKLPMAADKSHEGFELTLPVITEPLAYRLEIGDSQSRVFNVTVRRRPAIEQIEVTLRFPEYIGRGDETRLQENADLQAPLGTVAELRIRSSEPIATAHIQAGKRKYAGRVADDGKLLAVELPMLENSTFTIHMFDDAGFSDPNPRVNELRVLPDDPPGVQLIKPVERASAAAGETLPMLVRASDDHGIGRLRLEMKTAEDEAPEKIIEWDDFRRDTAAVRKHDLELSAERFKPGQTVSVRAVVWDNRRITAHGLSLYPQQTIGSWHAVEIVDAGEKSAAELAQLDQTRKAIWAILQTQIRTRLDTAKLAVETAPTERERAAASIRSRQVDIRGRTLEVVESIDAAAEMQDARRTLNNLATGDMIEAVGHCDRLVRMATKAAFTESAEELSDAQDRIIETLRRLLDIVRLEQIRLLDEMQSRTADDLPDDVRRKLEELHDKLDEFLREQRKVIEATKNLAKKPVDDFTEEELQKLEELAATEDEWSRFIEEIHSDLSKLPDQDFANPSLLKELVEIQTEIEMAEGALTEKTADIAVPLEMLGAEMAEELKTNLEKWLPDTPDRDRWSQEEYPDDENKQAPMAELPGELEDLIGELMEEEEDLFDEMEDISSSAADSLDEGAGWDAADGPISNFSAKGVTGNRLPNTSEVGGRSGEGRTGKSSGEMVGDEAVGKGGRKTPSRLTPDPYVKGQIKDHSKDPSGGATGGGKESGAGGEGLEGPQRRSPGQRDMARLAEKQATLRNKAEGIDAQFRIMNFHQSDLKKLIEMMAQVERDIRAGRYKNALRQREIMADRFGNVKRYLEGEFEVRRDETSNLPGEIQKEILSGAADPSPEGWDELNREYFERLSQ